MGTTVFESLPVGIQCCFSARTYHSVLLAFNSITIDCRPISAIRMPYRGKYRIEDRGMLKSFKWKTCQFGAVWDPSSAPFLNGSCMRSGHFVWDTNPYPSRQLVHLSLASGCCRRLCEHGRFRFCSHTKVRCRNTPAVEILQSVQ